MISVVTYGRNDNYGYNLYKRTALGFNSLADILTEKDEILFADYNTPRHLPTLPEYIWDTLTPKALRILKVIRIYPEVHEQLKADSPLPVLENVARNAAIVRSDPSNHWILSTNPDVILVLASRWPHLDELLRNRSDSFYEMPRFDIPESVWALLQRGDPRSGRQLLRDWLISQRTAVVETSPDYRFQKFFLFDAPGDFQLAPRHYFFRLRGFDESMNKYLYSDANLAKRMWLLNVRRTDHLLGDLWVLHQDHYLSGEWARNVSQIAHSDFHTKVIHQTQIEANDETWGLQGMDLPFFALADRIEQRRYWFLPAAPSPNGDLRLSEEIDWRLQPFYRRFHYQPHVLTLYLREILQVLPQDARVVYVGTQPETLEHIQRVWHQVAPEGEPVANLLETTANGGSVGADLLLVDCYYERPEHLEKRLQLLAEQLQHQLARGRISEHEANEELARFADNADQRTLEDRLVPFWQTHMPRVRTQPGSYVVLLGCDTYARIFERFEELFAIFVRGMRLERTWLQRLHPYYQQLKVRMRLRSQHSLLLKAFWGVRLSKRRALRRLIGHESIMGWVYFRHVIKRAPLILLRLNLRVLYVHHRLVVLRVES